MLVYPVFEDLLLASIVSILIMQNFCIGNSFWYFLLIHETFPFITKMLGKLVMSLKDPIEVFVGRFVFLLLLVVSSAAQ